MYLTMALLRPQPGQGIPSVDWTGQTHMWSPNKVAHRIRAADPMNRDAVLRFSIMGANRGVNNCLCMWAIWMPVLPLDTHSMFPFDPFLYHRSRLYAGNTNLSMISLEKD